VALAAALLLFIGSCDICSGQPKIHRKSLTVRNQLFVYDFTLENMTIKERVRFLDSLGYQGVTFPVNTISEIEKLKEYQQLTKSETSNRLKIPAVFFSYNPENKSSSGTWKRIADQLAGTQTDIWIIVGKGKRASFQREEVLQFFRNISDYCDVLRLKVVIYPHDQTYIESAFESLPYLREANRKNLFTSFHLCHELRAGNGARMNEAIAEVLPFIRLASICGANTVMDTNTTPGYWDDAIKPLYKGDYDVSLFLEYLIRNGYKGPVALHTFGLKEPISEHFSQSLQRWRNMAAAISTKISDNTSVSVKSKSKE
jgi:sugar phosphate isomerase/epimerase